MTDHQPLPGIIWRGDLGQILLIQQGELQSPLLHQFANRCALQCGDPSKAGMQLELVDLRLRQHSAISHHHHPGQSKLFSQLLDLIRYRRGVSRVSRIHLHGHRTSLAIGHHPVDDDGQTLFPIAVVSKLCERTGAALIKTTRHVVKDQATFAQMASGQFFLDAFLALQKPVHGFVEIVLAGLGHF